MFSYLSSLVFQSHDPNLAEPVIGVKTVKQIVHIFSAALLSYGIYEEDFIRNLDQCKDHYSWFAPINYQISHHLHVIRFAIVEFEEYVCLTIRGSFNGDDWIANIDAMSSQKTVFQAHKGFEARVSLIPLKHIWEYAKEVKKPLIITGHSQGGAIAKLCAFQLLKEGCDASAISCITFGAPLVGNSLWPTICAQWPEVFIHYITKGDPVPVIFRNQPYNFYPAGKIILLTPTDSGAVWQNIPSPPLDYDSLLEHNNLLIDLSKILAKMQDVMQHKMKTYIELLTTLVKNVHFPFSQIVERPNIEFKDIIPRPTIKRIEGRSDPNGKIDLLVYGQHLSSVVSLGIDYTSVESGVEVMRRIHPTRQSVFETPAEKIRAEFLMAPNTKMVKSSIRVDVTNGCHHVVAEGNIPFRRVLLIGQTGAGKTLLKAALRDCELGREPHIAPRSSTHIQPQPQEKVDEGHLIAYEEWLGFVHASPEEFMRALDRAFSDAPMVIICVINADGTLLTDTVNGSFDIKASMFGLINNIRTEMSDIYVLYAITNYAALPSHKKDSTILEFKNIIKILDERADAEGRIFEVNSDPRVQDIFQPKTKTRKSILLCPVDGVQELYDKIRSHLDKDRFFSFEQQVSMSEKLRGIVKQFIVRYAEKIWEDKSKIMLITNIIAGAIFLAKRL